MAGDRREKGYRFPPLKWLMSFEAAARHMSFTAAAAELGLSQAAVSYQIKALEGQIGFALFERRPRHLQLTDMGHAYLPSIRRAFDELLATSSGLFGPIGEQSVTVRVAISFAVLCLASRLRGFQELYPAINVRTWSSIWANALDTQSADIDIRFGDGQWNGFEATRLTDERAVIVCSPSFAENLKDPDDLDRLADTHMISIAGQSDLWLRVLSEAGCTPRASSGYRTDTSLAAAELAAAGMGCAILLERFARPYLMSKRLMQPCAVALDLKRSHYLLVPIKQSRAHPEVTLLKEWLLNTDWDNVQGF